MNTHLTHVYLLDKVLLKVLGCLFITSSFLKAIAIRAFIGEVNLYIEDYFPDIFLGYEQIIAVCVCVVELVMGISAVLCIIKKKICIAYIVVLSFFVWLTGMNLFFPSPMGSIETCGCFGEFIHFTPTTSFVKSVLLLIVSIICTHIEYSRNKT